MSTSVTQDPHFGFAVVIIGLLVFLLFVALS